MILLLVAAAFLLTSALSRHYSAAPRAGGPDIASVIPARPEDRAIIPLLYFGLIDINRAGYRTLLRVPGIGPARARAIIRLRREKGGFKDLAELAAIRGIGPTTISELAGFLEVRSEK